MWIPLFLFVGPSIQTLALETLRHEPLPACSVQVRRVGWWMNQYGAPSPKRQWAYSNASAILRLDVGWRKMTTQVKTVKQYKDKKGKTRYCGTKALKATEFLGVFVWLSVRNLIDATLGTPHLL